MLAKNQINRNKLYNKAKSDIKNFDFIPFIQKISMDISSGNNGKISQNGLITSYKDNEK